MRGSNLQFLVVLLLLHKSAADNQSCLEAAKNRPNSNCCGSLLYNSDENFCCGETRLYPRNEAFYCCGAEAIRSGDGKACCNSKIYLPGSQGCCNNQVYTTWTQGCCSNRQIYDKSTLGCCGYAVYDIKTDFCCHNMVVSHTNASMAAAPNTYGRRPPISSSTYRIDCCKYLVPNGRGKWVKAYAPFDRETQGCCGTKNNRTVYDLASGACCGSTVIQNLPRFNIANLACCPTADPPFTTFQMYDAVDEFCCGNQVAKTDNHLCCDGHLFKRASNKTFELCCGGAPMDTASFVCCGNTTHALITDPQDADFLRSKTLRCCGNKHIDPALNACCAGSVVEAVAGTATECCRQTPFDPEHMVCDNLVIRDKPANDQAKLWEPPRYYDYE